MQEQTSETTVWEGREVQTVTMADVQDVLDGRIAYVVVRGFLDAGTCARLVERFGASEPDQGRYGVLPTLQVGKPLMPRECDEYFARTRDLNAKIAALYGDTPNQAHRVRAMLEQVTGWRALELEEHGEPYLQSLFVSFPPGAHIPLHVDRSADIEGLGIKRFPIQLSWNVYLQLAEKGGDLIVYDKTFAQGDGEWVTEQQGGFVMDDALLRRETIIRFRTGDFILFDANRYHTVTLIEGGLNRVYTHGFVSVDPTRGEMSFWT